MDRRPRRTPLCDFNPLVAMSCAREGIAFPEHRCGLCRLRRSLARTWRREELNSHRSVPGTASAVLSHRSVPGTASAVLSIPFRDGRSASLWYIMAEYSAISAIEPTSPALDHRRAETNRVCGTRSESSRRSSRGSSRWASRRREVVFGQLVVAVQSPFAAPRAAGRILAGQAVENLLPGLAFGACRLWRLRLQQRPSDLEVLLSIAPRSLISRRSPRPTTRSKIRSIKPTKASTLSVWPKASRPSTSIRPGDDIQIPIDASA